MTRSQSLLVVIMLGTLWGLVEILSVPTYVYCVAGIFFLALLIGLYAQTGYCLAAGIIACLFKTLHAGFMVCQWAGILSLAFSAELVLLFYLALPRKNLFIQWFCGAAIAFLALPLFTFWVTEVMLQPWWVDAGWNRIGEYALNTTLPAAVIGSFLFPFALRIGNGLKSVNWQSISFAERFMLWTAAFGMWLGNAV